MWNQLAHWTGLDDPGGHWYLFWSGFFGDLPIIVATVFLYRRFNCHVTGCRRLGVHHVRGTPYIVCRRHHPDDRLTVEHVHDLHQEAVKDN